MLHNRIKKNHAHIKKWAARHNLTAFRIYDRDIPNFPISVDIYGDNLVINYYRKKKKHSDSPDSPVTSENITDTEEGEVPESISIKSQEENQGLLKEISKEDEEEFANAFREMAPELEKVRESLGIVPEKIFLKQRRIIDRHKEQYDKLAQNKLEVIISEFNIPFLVNLSDYLDTGLFLDHRLIRKFISQNVAGKSFLNLFSYTSTASVYAAKGGALRTVSVDLSLKYSAWSTRNFALNNMEARTNIVVRKDSLEYLQSCITAKVKFDFIFVDPPSFSNSKKMSTFFDVQRDHKRLLLLCKSCLNPQGVILFSTNLRNFKLDETLIDHFEVQDITKRTIPLDFANKKVHKAFLLTENGSTTLWSWYHSA